MSETLESKDIVRRIVEEDEENIMVSFLGHDGYFHVPNNDSRDAVKTKLLESNRQKKEISFVYDKNLNILKIT